MIDLRKTFLTNSSLLIFATIFYSSFSFAAPVGVASCPKFYETGSQETILHNLGAGPVLTEVATLLKTQPIEAKKAMDTLDALQIKEVGDRAKNFTKEVSQLTQYFSREEIVDTVKKISKSGFFMGPLHEELVNWTFQLAKKEKSDIDVILGGLKSDLPGDIEERKTYSKAIIEKLHEYRMSQDNFRTKQGVIAILKTDSRRIRSLSDKKLIQQLEFLTELRNSPVGMKVLDVMIQQSLYDVVKISARRSFGSGSKVLGGTILGSIYTANVIAGFTTGNLVQGTEAYPLTGVAIIAAVATGIGIPYALSNWLSQRGYGKKDDLAPHEKLGDRLTSLPKESTVGWRRWTQRWNTKAKTTEFILAEQKAEEDRIEVAQPLERPIEQVKRDLQRSLTPNELTLWGSSLNAWTSEIIGRFAEISSKQDLLAKEFYKNRDIMSELSPSSNAAKALNAKNKEIEASIIQTLVDWNMLSLDVMTFAHSMDQYQIKGESEAQSGRFESLYLKFLDEKIKSIQSSRQIILAIAQKLQNRVDLTMSFLNEDSHNQMAKNIDEFLRLGQ
jgi:hypothetical protein